MDHWKLFFQLSLDQSHCSWVFLMFPDDVKGELYDYCYSKEAVMTLYWSYETFHPTLKRSWEEFSIICWAIDN